MDNSTVSRTSVLGFGVFELDCRAGELRKSGVLVHLPPQPFRILALLASRPGQIVTREHIRQQIWGDETYVDFERGLNQCVSQIRTVLGDDAEAPRYIETLPRRGYRFIYPVTAPSEDAASPVESVTMDGPDDVGATPAFLRAHKAIPPKLFVVGAAAAVLIVAAVVGLNVAGLRNRLLGRATAAPIIHSIAVLPLENLSRDPDQEYFADGMTEELITDLGKISALRVISRTSVMQYKGTKKTLPEIARELNVDAIVEGTVERSGNRVRITANLLYAATDRHLWAESYERDLRDVLVLQDEVARDIASKISIKLTPNERMRLSGARPVNPEAHRLCVIGWIFWSRRGEAARQALKYFQRAAAIDPNYAEAYAGIADAYNILGDSGKLAPREAFPPGEAAARKALELDDASAEAHTALALDYWEYHWDWAECEKELRRAIELNPNYATAHVWLGQFLSLMRRNDEGMAEAQRALQLDPLAPIMSFNMIGMYYSMGRFSEAIRQGQLAASLFPNFTYIHSILGRAYLENKMYKQAIGEFQKVMSLSGASPAEVAALGHAYAKGGIRGYYLWELRRLQKESKHHYVSAYSFAHVLAALGEKDQALSYLEKAYRDREGVLSFLQVDPSVDSLRSDPRFQTLLRRMNFPRQTDNTQPTP